MSNNVLTLCGVRWGYGDCADFNDREIFCIRDVTSCNGNTVFNAMFGCNFALFSFPEVNDIPGQANNNSTTQLAIEQCCNRDYSPVSQYKTASLIIR